MKFKKTLLPFLLSLALLLSCKSELNYTSNVEIFCPEVRGKRVLVYDIAVSEVVASIKEHIARKKKNHTDERYVILKRSDGGSVMIDAISPEEMQRCIIREVGDDSIRSYVIDSSYN